MTSIFVAKLDFGITNELLKEAFQDYGTVLKASVATDRETGKSRGFGFVEMADHEEAMNAIKGLDGSLMNGRPIAVKEAEQRPDTRPPRDPNAPRPDFNRNRETSSPSSAPRPGIRSNDDAPIPFVPPIESLKGEPRKVAKDKKAKDWDTERGANKPKMTAYKKSGKNPRFFDDDDDDDFDIHALNDDDYDEETDDDQFDDEDED